LPPAPGPPPSPSPRRDKTICQNTLAASQTIAFNTRTPDPLPSECSAFSDTYNVTSTVSAKTQNGGTPLGNVSAVVTLACPKATVITQAVYNLTRNWLW
jgi:hypothetical protein